MVEFEVLSDEEDVPVDPKVYAAKVLPEELEESPAAQWSEPPATKLEPGEKNAAAAMAAKEDGNSYFRVKEYDLAIEYYSQAILLCPEDPAVEEEEDAALPPSKEASTLGGGEESGATPPAPPPPPPSANQQMLSTFLSNRAGG